MSETNIGDRKLKKGLSQWRLGLIKFKRNRLAIFGLCIIIVMYTVAIFANFFAPYSLSKTHDAYPLAPPQMPKFIDEEGELHIRPFIYDQKREIDLESMTMSYDLQTEKRYPIYFMVKGEKYKFLNVFNTDIHLFGVGDAGKIFLFGTDKNARDLLSRVIFGSRVSLSVGLVGVFFTIVLGVLIGIASGYWGGTLDNIIQRIIEVILSFPRIPLWMALAAALPAEWSPIKIYFGVTIVLSLVNWGALARQIRGKVLSMRESEYVLASKAMGASTFHIIIAHLLPNTLSHVIVIATLSIPAMILGETMLSFLGLGIRPPMTSWGVLLEEAQYIRVLMRSPWIVIPAFFVIITVLGFNFFGDGLRDAADPFSN